MTPWISSYSPVTMSEALRICPWKCRGRRGRRRRGGGSSRSYKADGRHGGTVGGETSFNEVCGGFGKRTNTWGLVGRASGKRRRVGQGVGGLINKKQANTRSEM